MDNARYGGAHECLLFAHTKLFREVFVQAGVAAHRIEPPPKDDVKLREHGDKDCAFLAQARGDHFLEIFVTYFLPGVKLKVHDNSPFRVK